MSSDTLSQDEPFTTGDGDAPSNAVDDGTIYLSFILPARLNAEPNAEPSKPNHLLHIPHEVIALYSLKPRKWLLYIATTICGARGELRFIDEDEDITEPGMEEGVNPGDHFVFCLSEEPKFIDGYLRFRGHDQTTVTSQSRKVPRDLSGIYRGCPFTKVAAGKCHACHFIPHIKGDEYLDRLLTARSVPHENMTIDSHQNMLMMNVLLHCAFDNDKDVAFLKTPNDFLKTNDLPGCQDADPNEYRVTVHCFSTDQYNRHDLGHGSHSDLKSGSGSRQHTPVPNEDASHRPLDVLLDLSYVYNLFMQWGHTSAKEMLRKENNRYYPNGMNRRGENRQGKEEERRKAIQREQHRKEQEERTSKRSKRDDGNDGQVDENEHKVDFYDFFYAMSCMARGFTPQEFEAELERRQREMEEREAERIAGWRESINEQQVIECDEDIEHRQSCLEDDDDEKPISVQEALSRTLPKYAITPMPSMTFSGSGNTDSDDRSASESGINIGDIQQIKVTQHGDKRSVSHDSAATIDEPSVEDARIRRRGLAEDTDLRKITLA